MLKGRGRFRLIQPESQRSKDPSPLKVKEVWVGDRRYVACLNEEQRRKDAADREALVTQPREKLPAGGKELVGNKGNRKYLHAESGTAFILDEEKIREEARYDGHWVLRTHLADVPEMIAMAYMRLWMVEDVFRTMKSTLETPPVFHKRDETNRGHVFCSFLAVMLRRALELRLEGKGEGWEWPEVTRGLDELHEVEAVFQGHRLSCAASSSARRTGPSRLPGSPCRRRCGRPDEATASDRKYSAKNLECPHNPLSINGAKTQTVEDGPAWPTPAPILRSGAS